MRIQGPGDGIRGSDRGAKSAEPLSADEARDALRRCAATSPATDRVELSSEGLALSGAESAGGTPAEVLSAERLAELRQRIQAGTYTAPDVAERVARRMLSAGDL